MNKITLVGNYDAHNKTMTCKRLSNNYDVIPVTFVDIVKEPEKSGKQSFEGSIINQKGKVFVEVYKINEVTEETQDSTACELRGVIKKLYPVRTTKKNHKLQDMLVEAESQLVKIVAFEPCPDYIEVGLPVRIRGRLQSRAFTQLTTFGTLSKVVYELALKNLEVIKPEEEVFDPFDLADENLFDDLDEDLDDPEVKDEHGQN